MEKQKLAKELFAAIEQMRENHDDNLYYWIVDRDDSKNWAVVLGWCDGFDENEVDDCMDGTYRMCVKLAYQSVNSVMQCDYDIDWCMPYDENGEVLNAEFSIYPNINFEVTETMVEHFSELYSMIR